MNKEDLKKVKKWAIEEMEFTLDSFTMPVINKASHKNFEKAIEQNIDSTYGELENIKDAYEIFKVIEKW